MTLQLFPEGYTFVYRKGAGGAELVISCSPTKNAAFYETDFKQDVLYLCESSGMYFVEETDVLATAMSNFFRQNQYQRIVMIGFSKSGFGALLLSQLMSKLNPECRFSAICFSPQTLVYPRETPLSFPSYKALLEQAETMPRLQDGLKRFGTLAPFDQPNVSARIYCGSLSEEDMQECRQLRGDNFTIVELPFSSHLSYLPFLVDTTNAPELRRLVDKAYAKNATIEGKPGTEVADTAFSEMSRLDPPLPALEDLVDETFLALEANAENHQG